MAIVVCILSLLQQRTLNSFSFSLPRKTVMFLCAGLQLPCLRKCYNFFCPGNECWFSRFLEVRLAFEARWKSRILREKDSKVLCIKDGRSRGVVEHLQLWEKAWELGGIPGIVESHAHCPVPYENAPYSGRGGVWKLEGLNTRHHGSGNVNKDSCDPTWFLGKRPGVGVRLDDEHPEGGLRTEHHRPFLYSLGTSLALKMSLWL